MTEGGVPPQRHRAAASQQTREMRGISPGSHRRRLLAIALLTTAVLVAVAAQLTGSAIRPTPSGTGAWSGC